MTEEPTPTGNAEKHLVITATPQQLAIIDSFVRGAAYSENQDESVRVACKDLIGRLDNAKAIEPMFDIVMRNGGTWQHKFPHDGGVVGFVADVVDPDNAKKHADTAYRVIVLEASDEDLEPLEGIDGTD